MSDWRSSLGQVMPLARKQRRQRWQAKTRSKPAEQRTPKPASKQGNHRTEDLSAKGEARLLEESADSMALRLGAVLPAPVVTTGVLGG